MDMWINIQMNYHDFIQIHSLKMLLHPEPDFDNHNFGHVPRSRKNVMPEGKKAIKDGRALGFGLRPLISDIAVPVGMHI